MKTETDRLIMRLEEMIVILAELHSREMSPGLIAIYRDALLANLSPVDAIESIKRSFTAKTYGFPKPHDLIELMSGTAEEQAIQAWETLLSAIQLYGPYKSIRFEDGRITRAVEAMGGWVEVNNWTVEETKYRRAEFIKFFQSLNNGKSEGKDLAGIHQLDNAARGFAEHIPGVVCIGGDKKLLN